MPDWVADKKRRAEKIRAAKAELEAEARAAAEAEGQARAQAEKKREAEGRKKPGKPAAPPSESPDPKAQKNFTDPESRIMKTKDGFIQGYNAQAAVDAQAQVIVVHGLDANSSDQHQLTPMVDAVEANMGRKPEQVSADAGYCSDANLEAMESRNIDAYIAAGRAKHPTDGEGGGKRVAAMREKISAGGHDTPYRVRKQLPEPVFGQIKQARGFSSVPDARARQGRPRMGPRLPRPQHAQARPRRGAESVRNRASTRLTPAKPPEPPKSVPRPANTLQIDVTTDTIWTGS
jgi:Transposase DDE domain